ncbi:peptidylprolyl isomerase [Kurthia sibirica]|uniref:Peptidyl-prolyl cis-trans isomerase n=1 Tax=Kurthia sibirica TaxID=202750 RepID=A0A2U3AN77_9BACL|nr:peptidylprolyl isomerase [Kurthia sibirica]PWI25971.1 peptidylprolyl isomerase [Kurthia sibirica]GEK34996.1 peptidyl-prolyl cis-trans isomerase [Kurthia sibirica]
MTSKWFKLILPIMAILFIVAACGKDDQATDKQKTPANDQYEKKVKENPIATITMANNKKIIIELEPKVAPNTVANFIALANSGFYDGLLFHRIIDGFMIQGGDPQGNGSGGPDYTIKGEFTNNDFDNKLAHERGVISMARSQDKDSAGSQFFIMQADSENLNNEYAAFGKVTSGMTTVDKIAKSPKNSADKPNEDQVMVSVKVDTKGFDYPAPNKIK